VKNKDLIKDILEIYKRYKARIVFKHVYSHMKSPVDKASLEYYIWYGNYMVDKMANDLLNKKNDFKDY
jgi:hypothetical protein